MARHSRIIHWLVPIHGYNIYCMVTPWVSHPPSVSHRKTRHGRDKCIWHPGPWRCNTHGGATIFRVGGGSGAARTCLCVLGGVLGDREYLAFVCSSSQVQGTRAPFLQLALEAASMWSISSSAALGSATGEGPQSAIASCRVQPLPALGRLSLLLAPPCVGLTHDLGGSRQTCCQLCMVSSSFFSNKIISNSLRPSVAGCGMIRSSCIACTVCCLQYRQ